MRYFLFLVLIAVASLLQKGNFNISLIEYFEKKLYLAEIL